MKREYLIAGALNGAITLWDTEKSVTLANFYGRTTFLILGHSMKIVQFVSCPVSIGRKLRSGVLSVGLDSTICGINIEDLNLAYIFTGHGLSIKSIHWRSNDEILLIRSSDDLLHVWCLKSGHLDRLVEDEKEILDILSECDYNDIINFNAISAVNLKKTIVAYCISDPVVGSYLFDTRYIPVYRCYSDQYQTINR
jgi:WD40 repeat protein